MPRSLIASIHLTHNVCRITVRDEHACGGISRVAVAAALRIAADLHDHLDPERFIMAARVDGNVVEFFACADWSPTDFGKALLEVSKQCYWDDRRIYLVGAVRSDIGVTVR